MEGNILRRLGGFLPFFDSRGLSDLRTKALTEALHPSSMPFNFGQFPNSNINYGAAVEPILNSIVAAGVNWYADMFPEAPITVVRENPEGEDEQIVGHPLTRLWESPNPFYSGDDMSSALMVDWWVDGNAYCQIIESNRGEPVELWFTPANLLEPKFAPDRPEFITHYEYRDGMNVFEWDPASVLHLRNGLDPDNPRKGMGRLKALLREIFTDDEAANYVASVLRNHAVPGMIITPKLENGGGAVFDNDSAKATKEKVNQEFSGDRRGSTAVINGPIEMHKVSWSPSELDLSALRNVSEERISAVMGLNSAVLNLGTGLESVNVGATMTAFTRLAWTRGMRPVQRRVGAQLTRQLLQLFGDVTEADAVVFDTSRVPALEEDAKERDARAAANYAAKIWTRGEARLATGRTAEDSDDVFLLGISDILVPRDTTAEDLFGDPTAEPEPEPVPEEPGEPEDDELDDMDDDELRAAASGLYWHRESKVWSADGPGSTMHLSDEQAMALGLPPEGPARFLV